MEISFKDINKIIKKNIILILLIPILVSLCTFFVSKVFVPKTYTATVKLYVKPSSEVLSGTDSLQYYNYAEKVITTYIEMLDTYTFFEEVSAQTNQKYTAEEISRWVTFSSIEGTEVFEANVISRSPENAKEIADALSVVAPKKIASVAKRVELRILDKATLPKYPTSPNTTQNVLVAFILGLLVALIISFIRDYFDVKIKYNKETNSICDLPVLGSIPDFEFFTDKKHNSLYGSYSSYSYNDSK